MPTIHPTVILEGEINLADDVEIGPYCILRGEITLGSGVRLLQQVNLQGPLTIGEGTIVYPNASLGFEPQDYKFTPGSPTAGVVIGEHCIIREHATVHAATKVDTPTRVGDRVMMMVNAHVGHDASVGNHVILVNGVCLAGHTWVDDRAILSACTLVHQFSRVGRMVMCSGSTVLSVDAPPFCMVVERNNLVGLNLVGMRRSGMAAEEINAVRDAFRHVFRANLSRPDMVSELHRRGQSSPSVMLMHDFVRDSQRGIAPAVRRTPRGSGSA